MLEGMVNMKSEELLKHSDTVLNGQQSAGFR